MNSLDDLLIFPNYTGLEINIPNPKIPKKEDLYSYKVKESLNNKNSDENSTNDNIFKILTEMKIALKNCGSYEDKAANSNFM